MFGKVLEVKVCSHRTMYRLAACGAWALSLGLRMACSAAYGGIVYVPEPVTVATKKS